MKIAMNIFAKKEDFNSLLAIKSIAENALELGFKSKCIPKLKIIHIGPLTDEIERVGKRSLNPELDDPNDYECYCSLVEGGGWFVKKSVAENELIHLFKIYGDMEDIRAQYYKMEDIHIKEGEQK